MGFKCDIQKCGYSQKKSFLGPTDHWSCFWDKFLLRFNIYLSLWNQKVLLFLGFSLFDQVLQVTEMIALYYLFNTGWTNPTHKENIRPLHQKKMMCNVWVYTSRLSILKPRGVNSSIGTTTLIDISMQARLLYQTMDSMKSLHQHWQVSVWVKGLTVLGLAGLVLKQQKVAQFYGGFRESEDGSGDGDS